MRVNLPSTNFVHFSAWVNHGDAEDVSGPIHNNKVQGKLDNLKEEVPEKPNVGTTYNTYYRRDLDTDPAVSINKSVIVTETLALP